MSETPKRRSPVALDLSVDAREAQATITEEPDFTAVPALSDAETARPRKRFGWLAALFWGAISGLIGLYLFDAAWSLIASLAAKSPVLGQVALACALLATFILLIWIGRELLSVLRLRRVDGLRETIRAARLAKTPAAARVAALALADFYRDDPETRERRARLEGVLDGLHDPQTVLDEAERLFLAGRDEAARDAIAGAAQRVSVVTAVSPRALIDILFVLAQSIRLIRRLSMIYGGRANGIGLLRLSTRVAGHLAITGGMAAADSVVSEVLGSGLAARLSAKLGEGVLNGVLTARVGIAAVSLCRPAEFVAKTPIILSEVVKLSLTLKEVAEKPAA